MVEKDPDLCHPLHQLSVEIAVLQETVRGFRLAAEIASKDYARRLELVELANKLPSTYATRELHDKLEEKVDKIYREMASWQGRLFMLSAVIAGIFAVLGLSVSLWHLLPKGI